MRVKTIADSRLTIWFALRSSKKKCRDAKKGKESRGENSVQFSSLIHHVVCKSMFKQNPHLSYASECSIATMLRISRDVKFLNHSFAQNVCK